MKKLYIVLVVFLAAYIKLEGGSRSKEDQEAPYRVQINIKPKIKRTCIERLFCLPAKIHISTTIQEVPYRVRIHIKPKTHKIKIEEVEVLLVLPVTDTALVIPEEVLLVLPTEALLILPATDTAPIIVKPLD